MTNSYATKKQHNTCSYIITVIFDQLSQDL